MTAVSGSTSTGLVRRAVVGLAAFSMLLVACDDQDPGLDQQIEVPDDGSDSDSDADPGSSPGTSSSRLQPCPEGGPDATTPAAGCFDENGDVVRPERPEDDQDSGENGENDGDDGDAEIPGE